MSPPFVKRLSDESLGRRLASGEAAAFDELYRRYMHRLAAYGAHLLGDGAAGDDVAQAALLKAYGALRDGRVPDRMRPWLYRIAHNVAIDLVSRRREWPTAELPEQPGAADAAPIAGALVEALASLPDRQRKVYVLRELHGLRIDETASELSLSATQVEQSLFAARNRLAEHLVFGDRLTCVSVQRLAAGPLDGDERRALKSHLRSCAGCRSGLGLRGRALSVLPVTSLEWLRGLVAGGGAPVAAKVSAAVATVTFAAGFPAAVETVHVHRLPVVVRATPAHEAAHTPQPTRSSPRPVPRSFTTAPARRIVVADAGSGRRESGRERGDSGHHDATARPTVTRDDGGDRGSGSSGAGGLDGSPRADGQTTTTVATTPTTTTMVAVTSAGSGDGGGEVSGGSDGGGDAIESHGSSDGGSGDGGSRTETSPTG